MSGASQALWQVADTGKVFGPYTTEMLQRRVDQGRFSGGALVWRDGFTAWEPIGSHFAVHAVSAAPSAQDRPKETWQRYLRWILLPVIAALTVFPLADTSALDGELNPPAFLIVRLGIIAALVAASAAAIFLWWRHGASLDTTDRRRGVIRVGLVALCAMASVAIFATLMATPLLYRVQEARISYRDYEVHVDERSKTLTIYGLVGPGLARTVAQELRNNPAIKTVILESDGGLIDEAMRLVRTFETRSLVTRVDYACNSACILIFMAGRQRMAERDAWFGFHASGSVTPITGFYNLEAMAAIDAAATQYLLSRGVPAEFEERARALGHDKLYPVSALRMAEVGAVTALLDGGAPISLAGAKKLDAFEKRKKKTASRPGKP